MTNEFSSAPESLHAELAALRQRVATLEAANAALAHEVMVGRTILQNFPEGVVLIFDHDLRYVESYGYAQPRGDKPVQQMAGYANVDLFPPDVATLLDTAYRAALAGEQTRLRVRFADGDYQELVLPLRDAANDIVGGMLIAYDITARTTAEEQLRVFEHLVAHAPDGIFVRALDGNIRYANQAFRTLFGYGNELVGMHSAALVFEEDLAVVPIVAEQLALQQPWFGRVVYQRADGTTFPGQVTVFPIPGSASTPPLVGAIIRDISAAEQTAHDQQEQLRAAQEAVIRELATPLIPLAQNIVVMPLVGTIDTQRAQQVLETLLEGIVEHQAECAILDITGVKVIDTQVAQALIRVAQAAKLLGAQIILSGLGAAIAQTLIYLDVSLTGIVTVSNLQAGIAYALERRGNAAMTR